MPHSTASRASITPALGSLTSPNAALYTAGKARMGTYCPASRVDASASFYYNSYTVS
ncbi:hypothetical protein PABY_15970 [Pyrodictium abyssi]|uniref:Uncharacterized protein n=1 Tax=Pyrodictium abyssi TaxID=54256 RepID=A0ABN6ZTE3_9CREN|nr:hypothetical protein PABY_15970 [Pyrodictium abyssi]